MRYHVLFADRSSMTVSEEDGKKLMQAKALGKAIAFRGGLFDANWIKVIKPINKDWFDSDYVEQQKVQEVAAPKAHKMIEAPKNSQAVDV